MVTHTTVAVMVFAVGLSTAYAKSPIPADTDIQKADALVQEVFGSDAAAAKTPAQRMALVKRLLATASSADVGVADRYAVLQLALHVSPDADAAMAIHDRVEKHFQVDGLRQRASTVWRRSRSARTKAEQQSVARVANQLVSDAVQKGRFDVAVTLSDIAVSAALKSRDAKLLRAVKATKSGITKRAAEFNKVKAALAAIKADPTDAASKTIVGEYRCFVIGDWDSGLPMLAAGRDEKLKQIATQELARPDTSNRRAMLANSWYEFAHAQGKSKKIPSLRRAAFWYEQAQQSQPPLKGLKRVTSERRSAEIAVILNKSKINVRGKVPTKGLVAHYRFEKIVKGVVRDASGKGRHGKTAATSVDREGRIGNGQRFKDSVGAVVIPRPVKDDFTIALWVKTTQPSPLGHNWWDGKMLIDGDFPGTQHRDFGISRNGGKFTYGSAYPIGRIRGPTTIRARTSINNGHWHHLVVVRESKTGRVALYVNGVVEAATTHPVGPLDAAKTITIGAAKERVGVRDFTGLIGDVRFYDRVLSAKEIRQLVKQRSND